MPKSARRPKYYSRQPKSKVALGIAVLLFLATLILIGKLFGFLGGFNQSNLDINQKVTDWNGKSPLNLVIKDNNIYLLSYQPKDKSLTLFKFPQELYLDAVYDFGKWPARSIYDLGQAEKPPIGASLLKDTVGNAFGLVPDGYMILNDQSVNLPQLIEKERANVFPGVSLISKSKTNLNILEYLKIWWTIKNIRSDKIKTIDLEKSDLTTWLLLPDGSRVIVLDSVKLDQFGEGRFEDSKIKEEALSIGVYNATDFPGLAEKTAKIIANLGGRVTFTSNAPEKSKESTILAKKSYTSDYLSKKFNLAYLPDNNNLDILRADIIIVLGENFFLKYKK